MIDTGLDPVSGRRSQWDDGNNALAIGPRVAVVHERNTETILRLEGAGVRVIQVPGSELASTRGGPRCMSCPVGRDPAAAARDHSDQAPGEPADVPYQASIRLSDGNPAAAPASPIPQPELAPA